MASLLFNKLPAFLNEAGSQEFSLFIIEASQLPVSDSTSH